MFEYSSSCGEVKGAACGGGDDTTEGRSNAGIAFPRKHSPLGAGSEVMKMGLYAVEFTKRGRRTATVNAVAEIIHRDVVTTLVYAAPDPGDGKDVASDPVQQRSKPAD